MTTVPRRPSRRNPSAPPHGPDLAALGLRGDHAPTWTDAADVRAWLAELRAAFHDLAAAAEDQARAPGRRDLGRRLARRTILDATDTLETVLGAALRSLAAKGAP